ncbi:MAG: hypothetical protein AB8B50_21145 [Pirellulaceae bacterium]
MTSSKAVCSMILGLVFVCGSTMTKQASASNEGLEKLYKVQVEYWFFDTDHYHWSTYYETTNPSTAGFVYLWLLDVKDRGDLPVVVPNAYWRYIPVDVRLITTYRLKPQIKASQSTSRYGIVRP